MGKWTKTIKNELNFIFPNHINSIIEEDEFIISFSFQSTKIAGQEVLFASMEIQHKNIEREWCKYREELLLQEEVVYSTISVNTRNQNIANSITNDSIVLDGMSKNEVVSLVRDLYQNKFQKKIDYYKSIENCNKIINKDIKITKEVRQFTSSKGLPFKKVLFARESNDKRFQEILNEMKLYCDECYEIGKKESFEEICRLKPVFEKLFRDFN